MRTALEDVILVMANDLWGKFTDGEVESPTGYFGVVEITGTERAEGYVTDDPELDEALYSANIGYYFFVEDNYGNLSVEYFSDLKNAESKFKQYSEAYSAWVEAAIDWPNF